MTLTRRLRAAVFAAALTAGAAAAQVPTGVPCPCPPGTAPLPWLPGYGPATPSQPGAAPSQPGQTPAAPGQPAQPGQAPTDPAQPNAQQPNNQQPQTPPANDALASATASQGGGAGDASSLPGIIGDFFGGAAVPVAVQRYDAGGNPIGTAFRTRVPGTNTFRVPTGQGRRADDVLFNPAAGVGAVRPVGTPVAFTQVLTDVDPTQIAAAARIPTFNRGQFKVTENETPRPTTRAYFTYNFYDNIFKSLGENTPRVSLHQESFGYEQAFGCNDRYSVGLRLPYNQVVSPGYYNSTSLGDLTIVTKAVIAENRATGDLLSGGLSLTVPTGGRPTTSFGTDNLRSTLIQPYLGYILKDGDAFLQGFSSLVVPTSSAEPVLYAQSLAVGYALHKRPGATLSAIYPVFEAHLTTPLNHRGDIRTQPNAFPDNLTLLGGTYFELYGRSTIGFAAGAPVTGPRPFSLQATVLVSVRF